MKGLDSEEAKRRLRIYGPNTISRKERFKLLKLFIGQFKDIFVILLLFSAVISYLLGETLDAVLIFSILIINGVVGFLQEYQAERTLEKLKEMIKQKVKVYRDGRLVEVNSEELVPGDVIVLGAGDKVPADCEIIAGDVSVNEAPLTGESVPVSKTIGDEIFAGTLIVRGRCEALVRATGMETKMGKIASLSEAGEKTPFVMKMEKLSMDLGKKITVVVVAIAAISYLQGHTLLEVLELATSLGVAAVPEGLPIITTICLALGVWRMAKRKAVVKTLPAAEALGSVDVLCVDKTGTLTQNRLVVKEVWGDEEEIKITASLTSQEEKDPVDIALREWAGKRRAESFIPFDSKSKRAVAYHRGRMYVKGAPEVVMKLCRNVPEDAWKKLEEMASKGLRVIGFASGKDEESLEFHGFVGLYDPPRPGVKGAIEEARKLGIEIKMITGDHPLTAMAIAMEIGLEGRVVSMEELDNLRREDIEDIAVFARVSPEDKYKIVDILQKNGYYVAMTGDGVNDAPALRKANVGIALGSGTDIAKEAADIVLLDDNLETIVNAVKEGRTIFKNVSNSVKYLFSMNLAEIFLISMGLFERVIILRPIQILWMNLVTDSLPAISFAYDTYERAEKRKKVLDSRDWRSVATVGLLLALFSFISYKMFGNGASLNTLIYGETFYQPILRKKAGAKENNRLALFLGATLFIQLIGSLFLGHVIGLSLPSKEMLLVLLLLPLFHFLS